MTWLGLRFAFKIAVTALAVVGPALLARAQTLAERFGMPIEAAALARLYGVALLALLVGYGGGLLAAERGEFPTTIVAMGIVSNAGATLGLVLTGLAQRHRALTVVFAAITVALVAAAVRPAAAMSSAW